MARPHQRCPKCGLRLRIDRTARCPICDALIVAPEADPVPPAAEEPEIVPAWMKNLGLLAAFVLATCVWVRNELSNIEPVHIPQPVHIPRLPDRISYPDASPEECERVRAIGGECASYSTVRTCDDAGVMTDELCGLGAWPCVRDGCGPGVRCCVPGTFDASSETAP
jgi:hypothetical protein